VPAGTTKSKGLNALTTNWSRSRVGFAAALCILLGVCAGNLPFAQIAAGGLGFRVSHGGLHSEPSGRSLEVGGAPPPTRDSDRWSAGVAAVPILGFPDAHVSFCHVRRFAVQISAKGPDSLGSCLTITAYRATAPNRDRVGGDPEQVARVIAADFLNDAGSLSSCGFWGYHEVQFRGALDTLRIGGKTFLEFRRLSANKREQLCGQPTVLLYVTKQWLYRFYLPDSEVKPHSQEWRVLESFQPLPNERN